MSWFESDGVRLRAAESSDAEALFGYLNERDMYEDRQLNVAPPWPISRAQVERHLSEASDTNPIFVIESGGAVVGHITIDLWWDALQPWVSVAVAPQRRRNGYGLRAATMVLEYLFDRTPAHVVVTGAGDWNEPGRAFAESLGFSPAGRFRHDVRREGVWRDIVTFDLLRREWEERRAADR